ncbi:TIGR03085 family metal-binding protein [Kitasatospora sp. NPDC048540]|uniref:TIGR03085 family metal-binding protein n=1 Tax=unclassified Kitasatospora TaxID=2633591 RepID=UPI0005395EE3|nr:TIGR03085 family metal-binding protein [Kitasatospora sp. MBT63]
MATTYARVERERLASLLAAAGPGAATLCGGWRTRELAAHLVLREHRPDAAAGIRLRPLAGWNARVQASIAARPYEELLRTFRAGPPRLSPFALPGADEAANLVEYFVHAEDVRRAADGWDPAQDDGPPIEPGLAEALWRRLPAVARFGAGVRLPVRLEFERPDGRTAAVPHRTGPTVRVRGESAELMLFAFGRGARAAVEAEGAPQAVALLAGVLPLP